MLIDLAFRTGHLTSSQVVRVWFMLDYCALVLNNLASKREKKSWITENIIPLVAVMLFYEPRDSPNDFDGIPCRLLPTPYVGRNAAHIDWDAT